LASAEDALSDALVSALNHWPRDGVPKNPEAWLLQLRVVRSLMSSVINSVVQASEPTLVLLKENSTEAALSTEFPDERLKLLFVCAHPAIDPAMHTPYAGRRYWAWMQHGLPKPFLSHRRQWGKRLFRAKTKSAVVVFRSKSRKSVIYGGALTPCWKRFTPPSDRLGRPGGHRPTRARSGRRSDVARAGPFAAEAGEAEAQVC